MLGERKFKLKVGVNLTVFPDKLSKLEEKYIFEGLKKEVYEKYKANLDSEILKLSQSIAEMDSKLSNQYYQYYF